MSLVRLSSSSHLNKMMSVFDSLYSTQSMVDVTLASNEGMFIQAHKVILAASSPYFKELLCHLTRVDNSKFPVIYMKDVAFKELKWIVDYMYRAEVDVPQGELDTLLGIARDLKIRGLGEVNEPEEDEHKPGNEVQGNEPVPLDSGGLQEGEEESSSCDEDEGEVITEQVSKKKRKRRRRRSTIEEQETRSTSEDEEEEKGMVEAENDDITVKHEVILEDYYEAIEDNNGVVQLLPPPSVAASSTTRVPPLHPLNSSSTVESVVQEDEFSCVKCGKRYRSSKSLWRHKKFACEGKHSFVCNICLKVFSRSDNLRRHAVVAHCAV